MDIELAQALEENKMLSKHILELQNDKGELVDKCKKLEAQIEKLKNCENCKFYNRFGHEQPCCDCENWNILEGIKDYWEMKEK